jgi:23S rRNA pseudouridine1911/1915/1917 synthase
MSPDSANDQKTQSISVPRLDEPIRLDVYVARCLAELTRNAAQQLITEGNITVNGSPAKSSRALHGGEEIVVTLPPPEDSEILPESIPLDVLFEDEHIIAINKSAGMVVHPAPGHSSGTLVNALLAHCTDLSGINGQLRPGIVHRLDAGTTGVIVAAKHDVAHQNLAEQFQRRELDKRYQALVFGEIKEDIGTIETNIDRDPSNRLRMAVSEPGGRTAISHWRVSERWSDFSLLEVKIVTGRTHQIRVHCAHIKHPVVGDDLYAGRRWKGVGDAAKARLAREFGRPALHAWKLSLKHPVTESELFLEAPLPEDMLSFVAKLQGKA